MTETRSSVFLLYAFTISVLDKNLICLIQFVNFNFNLSKMNVEYMLMPLLNFVLCCTPKTLNW